jgi:hypothetical protein
MAAFLSSTDLLVNVYQLLGVADNIAFNSIYTDIKHPGTNKKIEGWQWDKRTWPTSEELKQELSVPTLTDPDLFGAVDADWQSGIGSNDDLALQSLKQVVRDGTEKYTALVNHGYCYQYEQEYYIQSDGIVQETFSGIAYSGLRLSEIPKPTIPVKAYIYQYDEQKARHLPHREFRLRQDFTPVVSSGAFLAVRDENDALILANIDASDPEFLLSYDSTTTPPLAIFNSLCLQENEAEITISGYADSFEILGVSTGAEEQVFYTKYSPILDNATLVVASHKGSADTTLSGYAIDLDIGEVRFGDYGTEYLPGSGVVPMPGTTLAIKYDAAPSVEYEAEKTLDTYEAVDVNLDSLAGASTKGFVCIADAIDNPVQLVLSADLDEISTDYFGPLYLGYNYGKLICRVLDADGRSLDGQEVTFETVGRLLGAFGTGDTTIDSITNTNGEAFAFYVPPYSIDALGAATDSLTIAGAQTTLRFTGLPEPTNNETVYLYAVLKEDDVLGIAEEDHDDYYEEYLGDNNIAFDVEEEEYEVNFRQIHDLPVPVEYTSTELSAGAKQIVFGWDADAINTYSGTRGAWGPLYPTTYSLSGDELTLVYGSALPDVTSSGDYKAYFAVTSTADVGIRAYVIHPITNRKIYSNTIYIKLQIPDSMNGVYLCAAVEALPVGVLSRPKNDSEFVAFFASDVYDGTWLDATLELAYGKECAWDDISGATETPWEWFLRTRRVDNVLLGMEPVVVSDSGEARIPLGFRIPTTGQTMASALDGALFLGINEPESSA